MNWIYINNTPDYWFSRSRPPILASKIKEVSEVAQYVPIGFTFAFYPIYNSQIF